jgi:hypothetical protein
VRFFTTFTTTLLVTFLCTIQIALLARWWDMVFHTLSEDFDALFGALALDTSYGLACTVLVVGRTVARAVVVLVPALGSEGLAIVGNLFAGPFVRVGAGALLSSCVDEDGGEKKQ